MGRRSKNKKRLGGLIMNYQELRKSIIEDIFNTLTEKGYDPENVNLSEIDQEIRSEYIQEDYEKIIYPIYVQKIKSTKNGIILNGYSGDDETPIIVSAHCLPLDSLSLIYDKIASNDFPSYENAYAVEKKKKYLVNVHHDLTICLEVEAESEEEACKLAEEKAECIEYDQEPYSENGNLIEEGWICVNADSSVIDEIK